MPPLKLDEGARGALSDELWFADLLGAAFVQNLTGRLVLLLPNGEGNIFFTDGMPVHASGTAMMSDFLGQLLVELGAATPDQIEAALAEQAKGRSLLGVTLRGSQPITIADVEEAMRQQTARRIAPLFAVTGARWMAEVRSFPEIAQIAVPVDPRPLLLFGLREQSPEDELRALGDALLGNSVKLRGAPAEAALFGLSELDRRIVAVLDRPRKVHQLEQLAERRRDVRALLKALLATGLLELHPARAGVAIKDVVRVQVPSTQQGPPPAAAPVEPAASSSRMPAPRVPSFKVDPVLVAELKGLHARLKTLNDFELLEIDLSADPSAIRARYTQLAKKFHPDTLGANVSPLIAQLAREVAAALNNAYATLSDPEKRARYAASIAAGTSDVPEEQQAARAGSARVKYEMGLVFLRKHDYKRARETLKLASEMAPSNGLYRGTLAWAMFADPAFDRSEAHDKCKELLQKSIESSPHEGTLHYWLGRVLKEREEHEAAVDSFRRTLRIDPRHTEAERELRLYDMRKNKADDKERSGISKLFKR